MKIKICDSIMGSGKTMAAIQRMNADIKNKYIYITPFLLEAERVKKFCPTRNFEEPKNRGSGKLDNLNYLLGKGFNIASTHALFKSYNQYTVELIKNNNYKLILDEVCDVVELLQVTKFDRRMLVRDENMKIEQDNSIVWINDEYKGDFLWLMYMVRTGNVYLYNDNLIFWLFPIEIFKAFKEVIVLTYMFDAQIQRYYYDYNNLGYEYIGTKKIRNGGYEFCETGYVPEYCKTLIDKVHILENERLNLIGDTDYTLSSSWYEREKRKRTKPLTNVMRRNLQNLFRHKFKCEEEQRLWTCYKDSYDSLKGKGYSDSEKFVSFNARSTNKYAERTHLAYCINLFMNPNLKKFLTEKGADVNEDKWALSELIQLIWRTAIRNQGDIWVYIPSRRMRELLQSWLKELSEVA